MLENYGDIVEAVGDWLARDDLNERIPDFIHLAELETQRDLELREFETKATITSSGDTATLPTDFI